MRAQLVLDFFRFRSWLARVGLGFWTLFVLTVAPAAGSTGQQQSLETRLEQLSSQELESLLVFVGGNALFTAYHEAAHMLISEFRIPVLGQEEDAADNLATIVMLADDAEDRDLLIINAMIGWFLVSSRETNDMELYGAHGPDEQRGYRILCLMVGADEQTFADLARDLEMPEERIESCAYDYAQTIDSWRAVTARYLRKDGTLGGKVSVVHEPAAEDLESVALFLKRAGILEMTGKQLDSYFELPEQITLRSASCGESNAFWDPTKRTLTLCHELLESYAGLFLNELMQKN